MIELKGAREVAPNPGTITMNPFRYQVWSSVLGASVVSVNPDETPLKRKVYAGKAVIAELTGSGTGTYDNVTWKTSDPATGTVVSYWNAGTSNTGAVSEENEPLGQRIALEDPEEPFQPESYEQHFNFASDPDWQCQLPDSFQPTECQIRAEIAAASSPGGGNIIIYDRNKRPGNSNYIHIGDSQRREEPNQRNQLFCLAYNRSLFLVWEPCPFPDPFGAVPGRDDEPAAAFVCLAGYVVSNVDGVAAEAL